jgi:hypothetical protein
MMINAVAVVQEFYRAMGAGDVEHIAALLSPDLEWTGAESFPYYSGLWRGPQAVIDNLLLLLARDWDGFSATRTNFSLATSGWFRFAPLGEACPLLVQIGGSCATEKSFNSTCTPIQRRCSTSSHGA